MALDEYSNEPLKRILLGAEKRAESILRGLPPGPTCRDEERCVCPQLVTLAALTMASIAVQKNLVEGGADLPLQTESARAARDVMPQFVQWLMGYVASEPRTSLDELVPMGPVRLDIN